MNKFDKILRCFKSAVAIPMTVLFFTSCAKSLDRMDSNDLAWPASGNVKMVHASPKLAAIDVGFDTDRLNYNFFNYTFYTDYIGVTTGNNVVKIFRQGAPTPLLSKTISFEAKNYYTLFVVDTLSKLELVTLNDGSLTAFGKDSVKLRFANMSPDAGAVDFYIQGDEKAFASNISYKNASSFLSYKVANDMVFIIKPAGQSGVLSTSAKMKLLSGKSYTIMSSGFKNLSDDSKIVLSAILR